MNGIWVVDQGGDYVSRLQGAWRMGKTAIDVKCEADRYIEAIDDDWMWTAAWYKTTNERDRAWQMLEKAIATGVRLFRFPTQEEIEKEEREE